MTALATDETVAPHPEKSDWGSNFDWPRFALCKGDDRFITRQIPEPVVAELIEICGHCPVKLRCLKWAEAQVQPVGFVVAGGRRWKAWNHCVICGKKVRGVDLCRQHAEVGTPIGTITSSGEGHDYTIMDNH